MKKIFIAFILFFSVFSFANAQEKTIRELHEEVQALDASKQEIESKITEFIENSELRSMIRTNLTYSDIQNLQYMIQNFSFERKKLRAQIKASNDPQYIETKKNELLSKKSAFYKSITDFIAADKYNAYLGFVEKELAYESEKNTIEISKTEATNQMEEKVEVLQEKIEEHKSYLDANLRLIIEQKIDTKLEILRNNESFAKLSQEQKIAILNQTIDTIVVRREQAKQELTAHTVYYSDTINKKLELYDIGHQKLVEFRNSLKN